MSPLTVAAGLLDILSWRWRYWLCEAIDRVGRKGHEWLYSHDPPACMHCGVHRGANYKRGRWT
jgi:hypothetical protein